MAFCLRGASKLGTLVRGGGWGVSSTTLNEIMSTMLDTSFFIFSGSSGGSDFPVRLRLHRYMANANSGKRSCPDLVVSDRIHICDKALPGSLDRKSRSRALSPDNACSSPTADLNNCSNLA